MCDSAVSEFARMTSLSSCDLASCRGQRMVKGVFDGGALIRTWLSRCCNSTSVT